MEVVGKSKALIVLESCLHESSTYFSNHEKILRCNPYCKNVSYIHDLDIFQWTFEVDDPKNNPIIGIFFVKQIEEHLPTGSNSLLSCAEKSRNGINTNLPGKRIRWVNADTIPDISFDNNYTFIGRTHSEIHLLHQTDDRTAVDFETYISLDFTLSFPLNLMPENILKFMTEKIMSKIMQQATESMLCQVQSDICCSVPEISVGERQK
ncbi:MULTISPECIES: DUF1997 domain-containing protein [Chlorobiaceae]|uniref:DUF1997 domain-containing protein n=1 Tax=Chlorobium phaeovibrioides TaxID=1094 RepID=A0A432AS85_CHLPH|nr:MULTISPECIES: DUF1997 domain-containing protein [Chlorobiaceae]MWV55138.1 hypothetical protein [Chlorobium phaeovibrioides]QEQ57440.1 DUF1997 domain-containing protein [Chlorobium phaeovibrioides]RDD30797.1 hypothetical protein CR161_08840 [Prosthecochloris sp. ZM]RTY35225.1 DUF1997 domain-containing protein [Chlorobium phaeovibrioides]